MTLGRCFSTFAICLVAVATAASADVRVNGSTTVAFGLMQPQQAKIEELAGTKIEILPSSTSHGLIDLAEGRADIAMLAESLATLAPVLNGKSPGLITLSDYSDTFVGKAKTVFIVNPANPVRKLTRDQLAGLFSGRIKNWTELGGNDQPVLLVGEPSSTPHRLIRESLGIAYSPELRVVQSTNQTAIIVAQAPGAISYISDRHMLPQDRRIVTIDTDLKLTLPLHLVSRRDAPGDVRRVIEAAVSLWVQ